MHWFFLSQTDCDVFKIQLSFPQACHIFIIWLLLSWKHLSVKHLQNKCFTEITKTLSKINSNIIQNESVECYFEFEKVFVDILYNSVRPFKRKFPRAIYAPCMTKRLRKAIMKRSRLKSIYLKIQTQDSTKSYKKQ